MYIDRQKNIPRNDEIKILLVDDARGLSQIYKLLVRSGLPNIECRTYEAAWESSPMRLKSLLKTVVGFQYT